MFKKIIRDGLIVGALTYTDVGSYVEVEMQIRKGTEYEKQFRNIATENNMVDNGTGFFYTKKFNYNKWKSARQLHKKIKMQIEEFK